VLFAVLAFGASLGPSDDEMLPVALADLGVESPEDIGPFVDARAVRDPDVAARLLREAGRRATPRRRAAPFRRAAEISRAVGDLDAYGNDVLAAAAAEHARSAEDAAQTLERALGLLDVHDALDGRLAAEVAAARLLADGTGARAVFGLSRPDNTTVLAGHRAGPAGFVRFDLGDDLTVDVDALDLSVLRIAERGSPRILPVLARTDLGDTSLLAVPVDDELLQWFGQLGAVLLAFEAGVGGHPLSRAALLLQWASTMGSDVGGHRFVEEEERAAFQADAKAAFDALPQRSRAVLGRMLGDADALVRACDIALFGGRSVLAAHEEAVRFARALRTIGEEAPELRTIEEEVARVMEGSLLRAAGSPTAGPARASEPVRASRHEAITVTRLAAVEARRGGDPDWSAVDRVWQTRSPGIRRALVDELAIVAGARSTGTGVNGIGWPYWRALLAQQRRRLLPPVRTWDARWETLRLGPGG
jgi:hypothetical protein